MSQPYLYSAPQHSLDSRLTAKNFHTPLFPFAQQFDTVGVVQPIAIAFPISGTIAQPIRVAFAISRRVAQPIRVAFPISGRVAQRIRVAFAKLGTGVFCVNPDRVQNLVRVRPIRHTTPNLASSPNLITNHYSLHP